MQQIDVLYIAGAGRSGSTLLDRTLGTVPGATSCNEVYRLFKEGLEYNYNCACGKAFNKCPFWKQVADKAFTDIDIPHIQKLYDRTDHVRHFIKLYSGCMLPRQRQELQEYLAWLKKLYFSLAEISGNSILIDSSKVPTRPLLLNKIPGINVYVVHLVRDLRAVAYSWQRQKSNPATGGNLPVYSIARTVRFWSARNICSELLKKRMPYFRVAYEEFALDPERIINMILESFPPLHGKKAGFLTEHQIELGPLHTIGGNPDRFHTGCVDIRLDLSWIENLSPEINRKVKLLGYPLLRRYGYTDHFSPDNLLKRLT